jgi:hypothetical protein
MLNKKFKKAISAVTMFATVVCLSGVSMLAPLSVKAATVVDGDIVHSNATNSDGTPALSSLDVYIIKIVGNKTFKRLVLNPQIFASYGHLKWENLKTVSQTEIDGYTTSSLVRVDGDTKVYALTPVVGGDTGAKSWVNVTADQFINGAGSDADSIYTINSTDAAAYSAKADITTVAQLKAFYKDGTLPAGAVSGDLTASLAASTPVSTNVPDGSLVPFTDVMLTAGAQDVSINSITVSANGLGDDHAFTNVALYLDGSKIGTSKSGINTSTRQATFNFSTPVAISANSSKTLEIKASVNAASTYVLGIKAATDIITAGGTVGGTFPIWGNAMSSVVNGSIGNVTLGTIQHNTTTITNNFGDDNVLLAGFNLTASTGEADLLQSIRLKNGGTNAAGIISNLKLVIDGTAVADGTYDSSTGYVDFNIDGNYKIKKSDTSTVEVYGDLGTANVGNTVNLYIKSIDDIVFVGETYGFGVQLASISGLSAVGNGLTITLATGDVSIDMDKAATPDKDVKAGTSGVVLGTFSITSNGENATVNQIVDNGSHTFEIQGSSLATGKISNVVMTDTASGATYDITPTFATDHFTLSMTDEISLVKGVKKTFQIKADLDDSINPAATLKVVIGSAAISITGDVSDSAITDITPSSLTSAKASVKTASLDWTTSSLTAKSVVPGSADVSVYQATLTAGTVSDVKLSTVTLTTDANRIDDFNDNNISKVDLYLNGVLVKSLSNNIVEGTAGTEGSITFNSLITTGNANVIKAGATVTLEAKATFAGSLTSTHSFALIAGTITARDAADNSSVSVTPTNNTAGSRTVSAATQGTLKVELLTSDSTKTKDNVLLAGTANGSGKYLGELKFTTANEKIKVTELRLVNAGTATNKDITEIDLVDSTGTVVASKTPDASGNAVFTSMSLQLPADQATSYFIAVKAKGMNVDGDATSTAVQNDTVQYHINATNGVVATGVDSGLATPMTVDTNGTVVAGEWSQASVLSKTSVISGSVLNSITNALTDGTLTPGVKNIIAKYTFTFDNGSNRTTSNDELKAILKNLTLTYTGSNLGAMSNVSAYIDGTSVEAASASTGSPLTWTNLDTLSNGGKVDGAVTLVITATPSVTVATTSATLQTSIATATGIQFIGAGEGSTVNSNNYLPDVNISGATLRYSA